MVTSDDLDRLQVQVAGIEQTILVVVAKQRWLLPPLISPIDKGGDYVAAAEDTVAVPVAAGPSWVTRAAVLVLAGLEDQYQVGRIECPIKIAVFGRS